MGGGVVSQRGGHLATGLHVAGRFSPVYLAYWLVARIELQNPAQLDQRVKLLLAFIFQLTIELLLGHVRCDNRVAF
ncbi:hypothetical protein AT984_12320 [Paucibacter sp. KCTC 42545]|nr:hypothetical protein AT984_12320 [Paucibacter sp. KCTC 42545]